MKLRNLSILVVLFSSSLAAAQSSVCSTAPGESTCSVAQEIGDSQAKTALDDFNSQDGSPVIIDFFYSNDCPHCHEALQWFPELKRTFPSLAIKQHEIHEAESKKLFEEMAKKHNTRVQGVPTFFVGNKVFVGFYKEQTCCLIIDEIKAIVEAQVLSNSNKEIKVPFLGTLRLDQISLLQFSLVLGFLDGLNPCAMWVLMFLMGLLVYTKSKKRMVMIGAIFVIASGVVYFGFMSAWFNLFLVVGYSKYVTIGLAFAALGMGLINMKELLFFKKGISLTIPEKAKPKIAKRARNIIQESNLVVAVVSTILLAVFVNFIELGCTIGLPALFTKILADKNFSTATQYGYMALYNSAYVAPLAVVVVIFSATFGHYRMSEKHGKILKLISGILMFALGLIMLLKPELLMFT